MTIHIKDTNQNKPTKQLYKHEKDLLYIQAGNSTEDGLNGAPHTNSGTSFTLSPRQFLVARDSFMDQLCYTNKRPHFCLARNNIWSEGRWAKQLPKLYSTISKRAKHLAVSGGMLIFSTTAWYTWWANTFFACVTVTTLLSGSSTFRSTRILLPCPRKS